MIESLGVGKVGLPPLFSAQGLVSRGRVVCGVAKGR